MARTGMAQLIALVRELTHAGTADHTLAGVTYWSDDQIQERLDRWRQTHKRVSIFADPDYVDGDHVYTEYVIPHELKYFEEAGADSGWALRDGDGVTVTADYTINYEAGRIEFDADQDNEVYYLDARTYDVYRAAAEVWDTKAGLYEAAVDWSSDNHSVKRSQQVANARTMAMKMRTLAGPMVSRRVRTDVNPMRRR
jgi:hypothetical protein